MDYRKYQHSRNAAWQILIDHDASALPIRISALCKAMGIPIHLQDLSGGDSYSLMVDGRPVIVVNDQCSVQRQRFTAAHELGHIVLGHVGEYTLVNREPSPSDNSVEHEANVFASRLLAPAIVLRDLGVRSSEEIARLCDISAPAAAFRWERLQLLYERERQFLAERGRSCFGMHPLEREVQAQFCDYIRNQLIMYIINRGLCSAEAFV